MPRATRKTTTKTFVPPELPPKSPKEQQASRELLALMTEAVQTLRRRNLTRAVLLAQQAASGRGPLVDHFAELGRRYADLLKVEQKPNFRVIEGGAGD